MKYIRFSLAGLSVAILFSVAASATIYHPCLNETTNKWECYTQKPSGTSGQSCKIGRLIENLCHTEVNNLNGVKYYMCYEGGTYTCTQGSTHSAPSGKTCKSGSYATQADCKAAVQQKLFAG